MACALPHHPLFHFLLLFLLPFSIVARTNGTVAVGTSITANNKDTPWLSPSGVFAFGFKPLEEKNLFLLSIWYYKIPDQTIVWYGHDGVPVSIGSKLGLTVDRGLVLSDPQGKELWNSQLILNNNVAHGFMNDTATLYLCSDSVNLWESFKNPTDTMLPTRLWSTVGSCWKKKLPLSNGRDDNVVNRHAFLKFRKRDPRTPPSPLLPETKKNQGTLILVGSVLLGSSVFINFVLIGAVCLGFFLIHHRKSIKSHHGNHSAVETNLRCFTYEELHRDMEVGEEEKVIRLIGLVDRFREGRLDTLVENDMEALNDRKRPERFRWLPFGVFKKIHLEAYNEEGHPDA
ncbi:G-type lectin S-receptor-like serine/threonine-protein kinase RLK1 [Camellia lanceoleosa]|uniref:G-type lectin S-receptor-like serine/threonine-protein kinase RLK1 n=1 Tax=Camellia lanceoleosa TaxID=1840588 RepID=A0ACC0F6N6_9ERIC|nr:G-type lectin S-receptor-like serine/threonine-protein kinase RLK1 [Camellia lanceoleosa]